MNQVSKRCLLIRLCVMWCANIKQCAMRMLHKSSLGGSGDASGVKASESHGQRLHSCEASRESK